MVLHWILQHCRGYLTVCVCPSCIHTLEEDRGEAATLSMAEQVASSLRLAVIPSTSSIVSTTKLFLFHIQYCALYNIIVPRTDCQRGSDKSGWLGKLCQEGKNSQIGNAHSELRAALNPSWLSANSCKKMPHFPEAFTCQLELPEDFHGFKIIFLF